MYMLGGFFENFTDWLTNTFLLPVATFFLNYLFYPIILKIIGFLATKVLLIIFCTILNFLSGIILDALINIFGLISISQDLLSIPLVDAALNITITIAISLCILMTTYSLFKSFFLYFGFEAEEHWKVIVRFAVASFFIFGSKMLFYQILVIHTKIIDAIWYSFSNTSFFGTDHSSLVQPFNDALLPTVMSTFQGFISGPVGTAGKDLFEQSMTMEINIILFFFILIKLIFLVFRFGERFIFGMLLIIFGPLAIACAPSPSTRNYFLGWSKTFFGNLIVQSMQVAIIALIFLIPVKLEEHFNAGKDINFDKTIIYILVIGAISVLNKLEELLSSIHISTGTSSITNDSGISGVTHFFGTITSGGGSGTANSGNMLNSAKSKLFGKRPLGGKRPIVGKK